MDHVADRDAGRVFEGASVPGVQPAGVGAYVPPGIDIVAGLCSVHVSHPVVAIAVDGVVHILNSGIE